LKNRDTIPNDSNDGVVETKTYNDEVDDITINVWGVGISMNGYLTFLDSACQTLWSAE